MCGFAGYFSIDRTLFDSKAENVLSKMASAISHRGPDGRGVWFDGSKGVAFAHTRLAIVDLSSEGDQPMRSSSGRYVLVLNGEIYNHIQMRRSLDFKCKNTRIWRGHSDTETLLECFEYWGIENTLRHASGMFAFAVWDYLTNKIIMGRDRFGEKPLYYGWQGEGKHAAFVFGSELSALKRHPSFAGTIDTHALSEFLRFKSVPGKSSIYEGINKLQPGNLLEFSAHDKTHKVISWWDTIKEFNHCKQSAPNIDYGDATQKLEDILSHAVRSQMQADVPLGAFLSGGIDSSLIVALMQKEQFSKVKTFSIGFNESSYDEAVYARNVAKHLNTEHTEFYVTPDDVLKIIPELPKIYSEPFGDSSQIPTFLVSRLAREHVTVALSGDAGDELFCGYNRYKFTDRVWKQLSKIPLPVRLLIYQLMQKLNPIFLNKIGDLLGKNLLGDKISKGSLLLRSESLPEIYEGLISDWGKDAGVVICSESINSQLTFPKVCSSKTSLVEQMMLQDTLAYLVDDILVKVDRAAMANGLETRVPFLDHEVVKFSWGLPLNYKIRNGVTKAPLREILYKYVPQQLIERPKMGFGVPIDQWLRGPLRDWAEDLLNIDRLQADRFFDVDQVRTAWEQHLSGKRNLQGKLWNILMFQAWYDFQKQT